MEEDGGRGERKEKAPTIFRDIRRYYCDYCGISRSKKSLLTSHLLSDHQEEMKKQTTEGDGEEKGVKSNTCEECGTSFRKPAYLKQHMLSHSLEYGKIHGYCVKHWIPLKELQNARGSNAHLEWISTSYRRKDHLTRHLLQHQGKLFECPVINCVRKFSVQGNMKRHVKEFHEEESPSPGVGQKPHVCPEIGCGKEFKYASKLRKHEDSHVKLDTVETFCSEPGCMKHFTNDQCLKAHIQSCHQHIKCEICGTKQLKKNIKRHIRTHEERSLEERIKCSFKGCLRSFSTRPNLQQHVNAVHLELKPFTCSISGCGMRFSFKHVRDNHEKSGCHVYIPGDFEESDEQFQLRPRGGRKRQCQPIDTLMRKRVTPPNQSDSVLDYGSEYLSWMLTSEADD